MTALSDKIENGSSIGGGNISNSSNSGRGKDRDRNKREKAETGGKFNPTICMKQQRDNKPAEMKTMYNVTKSAWIKENPVDFRRQKVDDLKKRFAATEK